MTFVFLIGWRFLAIAGIAEADFVVTKAEWKTEKTELKVEGTAEVAAKVVVYDADTDELLGSAKAAPDGRWRFKLKNPGQVPCRVTAESEGEFLEKNVKNAPDDCLQGPPVEDIDLEITKAEWKADKSELKVEGTGYAGASVVIRNTASMSELGPATVKSDGVWKFKLQIPPGVPCRVTAESEEQAVERDVKDAPQDCDESDLPPATLAGLVITGPASVAEGMTVSYTATAEFDDGSTQTVTDRVRWRIEDPEYADINAGGVLTALEVTGDQQTIIHAAYTDNSITQDAAVLLTIADNSEPRERSHADWITTFEGTKTCLTCHQLQARQVLESVHYQWKGDASETIGLNTPEAGKLGGINDFCIYPDINWIGKLTNVENEAVDGGCAKCHVGLGEKPIANPTPDKIQSQLENIDCLICHSDVYRRTVANVGGSFRFVPDTAKMTVSILQAAQNVTRPLRDSCLNCHTKAGGGNNFKRGDIEEAHRNPTRSFDVHMAAAADGGAGLSCLDCHTAVEHRIAGRGTDLRARELPDEVSCTSCHEVRPHNDSEIDKHTARVNCTVCHIPVYAKVAPTDMERDWSRPGEYIATTGLYEPSHIKGTRVVPEYRFFNGSSYFYQFGTAAVAGENGRVVMSAPLGDIHDPGAKIYAFKHHLATQPVDPVTQWLLPLKIGKFFETGEIATAVELGVAAVGWKYNGYAFAATERYMGLFHEVAPKEEALSCSSCHNGGTHLDFSALGYTPKETYNAKPLCASCHGDKSDKWTGEAYFTEVHKKHVADKGYDCSSCHIFSAAYR
jgi:hypothetical protein